MIGPQLEYWVAVVVGRLDRLATSIETPSVDVLEREVEAAQVLFPNGETADVEFRNRCP